VIAEEVTARRAMPMPEGEASPAFVEGDMRHRHESERNRCRRLACRYENRQETLARMR
jgi:hypothetical protein